MTVFFQMFEEGHLSEKYNYVHIVPRQGQKQMTSDLNQVMPKAQ